MLLLSVPVTLSVPEFRIVSEAVPPVNTDNFPPSIIVLFATPLRLIVELPPVWIVVELAVPLIVWVAFA